MEIFIHGRIHSAGKGYCGGNMSGIVVQCIAKLQLGGAQKIAVDLTRRLGDRGCLITGHGGKLFERVKEEFHGRHITLRHLSREINPVEDILCFFELRKRLIDMHRKFDMIIIHTHGSKAGVIGRLVAGTLPFCKSIHQVHGFPINRYIHPFKRFIYLNSERISSLFGDIILTVAEKHISRLKKLGISRKNNFYYIPNSVNLDNFLSDKREFSDRIVIGTVANFKPQKNPINWAKVAIKTVERHSDVKFIYVGDGKLRKRVEEITNDYENIKLHGWREDLRDIYGKMDIFFLPSRWEGLPLSILEAMASGVPVVASAVDGTVEAVNDGETGFLVRPDDIQGFVNSLKKLIENRPLREKMGEKGRDRVREYYNYDDIKGRIFNIYNELSAEKIS